MRPCSLFCSFVLFLTVGFASTAWANSVYVSNSTGIDSNPSFVVIGTPVPYCQQSGTSSATCATEVSGRYGPSYVDSNGSVSAAAAFGALRGTFAEYNSEGNFVSSFGDEVRVTGGAGSGTLVTHYALSSTADSYLPEDDRAGHFSFVQGSTSAGFVPTYTSLGFNAPYPPTPPGCNPYGLCFSENFDVMSPVQFGTALPLGAQVILDSDELPGRPSYGGDSTVASSMLQLTGYTVLDADGNVVSDAVVTQQHVAGLDLFPAPEPGTWGLMLMGLAGLVMWRWRRAALPMLG